MDVPVELSLNLMRVSTLLALKALMVFGWPRLHGKSGSGFGAIFVFTPCGSPTRCVTTYPRSLINSGN